MRDQHVELDTGALVRRNDRPEAPIVVVGFGGGSPRPSPLADSPSLRWLLDRLGDADAEQWELLYRLASWHDLDGCIEDGAAAVRVAAESGRSIVLVGFSMGGAVATAVAGHPQIELVVAASPWLPPELPLDGVRGRPVRVVHGALDGWLPGIPGVPPRHSRAAVDRMRRSGVDATHRTVRGAVHPFALRGPWGRLIPAPGARRRAALIALELAAQGEDADIGDPAAAPSP